jgi:hypothetical protein
MPYITEEKGEGMDTSCRVFTDNCEVTGVAFNQSQTSEQDVRPHLSMSSAEAAFTQKAIAHEAPSAPASNRH